MRIMRNRTTPLSTITSFLPFLEMDKNHHTTSARIPITNRQTKNHPQSFKTPVSYLSKMTIPKPEPAPLLTPPPLYQPQPQPPPRHTHRGTQTIPPPSKPPLTRFGRLKQFDLTLKAYLPVIASILFESVFPALFMGVLTLGIVGVLLGLLVLLVGMAWGRGCWG